MVTLGPNNFGLMATGRSIDIVEGGAYYLPCLAYNKDPQNPISITWEDGNENSLNSSFERSMSRGGISWLQSTLEISCATAKDEMEYKCIVSDGIEESQASFNLRFTCKLI